MKPQDQYLKFIRWEDADGLYVGYCPDNSHLGCRVGAPGLQAEDCDRCRPGDPTRPSVEFSSGCKISGLEGFPRAFNAGLESGDVTLQLFDRGVLG